MGSLPSAIQGSVEQAQSIFYTRHSTLILPSNRRGGGCWGCCCCWLLKERTRSVIITWWKVHGIYSNNLVRTDHVCSCLVTSAAWEQIDQSCDDFYLKYWFAAYQRDTGWSYHWLPSVTGIRFTPSIGDRSSSTPRLLERSGGPGVPHDGKKGRDWCVMHHPDATAPTGRVFPQMQHPTRGCARGGLGITCLFPKRGKKRFYPSCSRLGKYFTI